MYNSPFRVLKICFQDILIKNILSIFIIGIIIVKQHNMRENDTTQCDILFLNTGSSKIDRLKEEMCRRLW